jgi:phosphatidylinositol 4-kinase
LTLNINNIKDNNKNGNSPKNININTKLINFNEINNNFFMNQKGSVDIYNNDQLNFSFLDDCTLDEKESESEIKSNRTSNSFNSQNSKMIEQNIEKEPNKINMPCIFKVGDDLRQDSLALQVIQIFREIFKQSGLNIYTYPYQTISTISRTYKDLGGYIEVVKDTDSRDQIGKTYETNLYDYYICSFGQENSNKFRNARKNLIISLAAYGIISYILQIKDRHNGNILIDKDGHLIHIDFGFIFDISPGGNMKFEKAAFKLTKEMIQIMEGTESEAYATFVDLTVRAFLACRDYMNNLLDPVYLMFSSGLDCFRDNSIKHFIERFKLDLNEEDAANYMRGLIKTAADNWRTKGYDLIQKIQNNISY